MAVAMNPRDGRAPRGPARRPASLPALTLLASLWLADPLAAAQSAERARGAPEQRAAVPRGFAVAAAAGYGLRLGGDLGLAEPSGGDSGPVAELVGRHRFQEGIAAGVGVRHAWLEVDSPVGGASLLRLFAEVGYVLEIGDFPIHPLVGSRLGFALESRSSPEFTGTRRAAGLDVGGFVGARLPLSRRVALETAGVLSFLILDRTQGTEDRSGQSLSLQAGLEVALE